jgi:hypothetical protein
MRAHLRNGSNFLYGDRPEKILPDKAADLCEAAVCHFVAAVRGLSGKQLILLS